MSGLVKVMSLLAKAGSGLLESELGQKWRHACVKGMYRLKLVSSRNNSVFKRLRMDFNILAQPGMFLWSPVSYSHAFKLYNQSLFLSTIAGVV